MLILLKSFLIGLAIAGSIDITSLLCIEMTLKNGVKGGIYVGIGFVLADLIYMISASLGFSKVLYLMFYNTSLLEFFGGLFLTYLGLKEFSYPLINSKSIKIQNLNYKTVVKVFLLNTNNIMAFFGFIGILACINSNINNFNSFIHIIISFCLGSSLWWIILTGITLFDSLKLSTQALNIIKQFFGSILIIFGLLTFSSSFGIWKTFHLALPAKPTNYENIEL